MCTVPRKKLEQYSAKRDFAATPEPAGDVKAPTPDSAPPRFVVQQHHATRLHWDLRLEHDGALASWAIPNGIPPDPKENRLAVRTEDHPLQYVDFQGEIPKGQYGAGTMRIWDHGTFETHKWEEKKVEVTFHGERLRGRYGLFPIGREGDTKDDWMIHRMDPPEDPGREPMPERVLPMLARTGKLPPDQERWSFEVKWDGVRAIAYAQPGRLRLGSRNLNEITAAYPEVREILDDLGMHEAVLDGEIVAFDERGKPSFERLQRRMHVTSPTAVKRLAASVPVVYAIFDLLYLDGRSLMELPYSERRARLEELQLGGPAWRVPAAHAGEGERLLTATQEQGLEGIVAKRLDSRYESGRRSGAWLKVKHTLTQELVIGGWLPGEGRRAQLRFQEPEGLDAAGLAQFGPLDPVLTVKFPALAQLPRPVGFEAAVPEPREFAGHFPAWLQAKLAPADERLDCRDGLADSACLFADAGLDVEQEKIAEVARCRGERGGRQPGKRNPVQAAQIRNQRVAAPLAEPVVQPPEVEVAAWLAVFAAAVREKRGEIRIPGFCYAGGGHRCAGVLRGPQIRSRSGDIFRMEAIQHAADPPVRVPHPRQPAVIFQVCAGDGVDRGGLILVEAQVDGPVLRVGADVPEELGRVGRLCH